MVAPITMAQKKHQKAKELLDTAQILIDKSDEIVAHMKELDVVHRELVETTQALIDEHKKLIP